MSVTQEEAIRALERADGYVGIHYINGVEEAYINPHIREAVKVALAALRSPTREIVERMRGEWVHTHSTDNFWTEVWKCSYCGFEDDNGDCFDFCPECGQPKTDEAVDILWQRWKEALKDG